MTGGEFGVPIFRSCMTSCRGLLNYFSHGLTVEARQGPAMISFCLLAARKSGQRPARSKPHRFSSSGVGPSWPPAHRRSLPPAAFTKRLAIVKQEGRSSVTMGGCPTGLPSALSAASSADAVLYEVRLFGATCSVSASKGQPRTRSHRGHGLSPVLSLTFVACLVQAYISCDLARHPSFRATETFRSPLRRSGTRPARM